MTKNEIREIVLNSFNLSESEISDDTPLFSGGYLDSFAIVELVASLQERIETKIPAKEIRIENFDTINRMQRLLSDHLV